MITTNPSNPPILPHTHGIGYFLATDNSTQWFTKLVRQKVEVTHQPQKKGPDLRVERVVEEDLLDCPVGSSDFLSNIYQRNPSFHNARLSDGQSYGGWALSRAEYDRIARLIELWPAVQEFQRLAAYNV